MAEEKINNLVLDSSVLIKWFCSEKSTDKAVSIRDSYVEGETNIAVRRN